MERNNFWEAFTVGAVVATAIIVLSQESTSPLPETPEPQSAELAWCIGYLEATEEIGP